MTTTEFSRHATITVAGKSWEENRIAESDAVHAIASAKFTTSYAGDLVGESTCGLLINYSPAGDAPDGGGTPTGGDPADPHSLVGPYTGFEHVRGTLDGRTGTFVLAMSGEHRGGLARTDVRVVPGSGTGELAGLRGAGYYAAEAMEYTMELDYSFEPGGAEHG